jgi:predicted secreted protein
MNKIFVKPLNEGPVRPINKGEETPMAVYFKKKIFIIALFAVVGSGLWALPPREGDSATFVDLGFSKNGKNYFFAQYGVLVDSLLPWADFMVVDVAKNDYVPGGRFSYVDTKPIVAGQNGSGVMHKLMTENSDFAKSYGADNLNQGRALYISLDDGAPGHQGVNSEDLEFRDFDPSNTFKVTLTFTVQGSDSSLKSSSYIMVTKTTKNGEVKHYKVGTLGLERPGISAYHIRKVLINPGGDSMIFVIELRKGGTNVRYMVEALKL